MGVVSTILTKILSGDRNPICPEYLDPLDRFGKLLDFVSKQLKQYSALVRVRFFSHEQLVAHDVLIGDEGFHRISHSLTPLPQRAESQIRSDSVRPEATLEELLLRTARWLEGFSSAKICKLCSIRSVTNWIFLAEFEQLTRGS